jgi:hypothetical protein
MPCFSIGSSNLFFGGSNFDFGLLESHPVPTRKHALCGPLSMDSGGGNISDLGYIVHQSRPARYRRYPECAFQHLPGSDLRISYMVVSATPIHRKSVSAIEVLEGDSRYLIGLALRMWWYRLLWCIGNL